MKSKNELKEIDIKNRVCYYFNDIVNGTKINCIKIKWYKTPIVLKPLRIRFGKIDRFIISVEDNIKHLILFDYGLFDKSRDKIRYLISKKVVLQII